MISPLEQFKVLIILPINVGGIDISITNATIYLLVGILYLYVMVKKSTEEGKIIPNQMQRIAEMMYMFINNLVKQQGGRCSSILVISELSLRETFALGGLLFIVMFIGVVVVGGGLIYKFLILKNHDSG